ncbi:hypothetical protein [Photobacterium rosenbergii]|uniref:Uncharacterized protein n=1 Tax=Photobacterium rosenbergii TaxID=294936 RepID=A0ABU3ZK98_9GAMM|nr:hypothetical protein [Photobacterium rosenbergii]MDV5170442.1 hypothetical protein [Photobacterium rosenbergii]
MAVGLQLTAVIKPMGKPFPTLLTSRHWSRKLFHAPFSYLQGDLAYSASIIHHLNGSCVLYPFAELRLVRHFYSFSMKMAAIHHRC